jgi:hypothetical protein
LADQSIDRVIVVGDHFATAIFASLELYALSFIALRAFLFVGECFGGHVSIHPVCGHVIYAA